MQAPCTALLLSLKAPHVAPGPRKAKGERTARGTKLSKQVQEVFNKQLHKALLLATANRKGGENLLPRAGPPRALLTPSAPSGGQSCHWATARPSPREPGLVTQHPVQQPRHGVGSTRG